MAKSLPKNLNGVAANVRGGPRANRYFGPGKLYDLTHRCRNRQFLFKFARDRDQYRQLLR